MHEKSTSYPSGPLQCFSDNETWLFLIQVHVFGLTGIVDENCQQDDGSMEEEAQ